MSELTAYHCNEWHNEYTEFYLKYEADKVIAEKDKEIAELIEKNKRLANKDIIMASETIKDLYKELRHSNHMRCLAMAMWCFEKSYSTTLVKYDKESGYRLNFYDWWGKYWLKLANKFKEAK